MDGRDDPGAALREQKRSALTRAAALQRQLEEKARELDDGAAAESAEIASRLKKVELGTSRVKARSSALRKELDVARSKTLDLQRKREKLQQEVLLRVPANCDNTQIVTDALLAFAEGASALFNECFAHPIGEKMECNAMRLQNLRIKLKTCIQDNTQESPCGATSIEFLGEAESLLASFAQLLDDGMSETDTQQSLLCLLDQVSQWQLSSRHPDKVQQGTSDLKEAYRHNNISTRQSFHLAVRKVTREDLGVTRGLWSTRSA
jgi:hypothetical protein